MIVTVTAHPSLDRTVSLEAALTIGDVQSAAGVREDAGGKGVNVAGVVAAAGEPAVAILPLAPSDPFGAVLAETGLQTVAVPASGRVRSNIAVVDPSGVTTKINLPGVRLGPEVLDALVDAVVTAANGADWLVLAGSLPPGAPEDLYVRMIRAVRAAHASNPRIAVDTSGPALRAVVEAGGADLIKPNEIELAELAGATYGEDVDLVDAVTVVARELVPGRVGAALVTLGARGAVLVEAGGAWAGSPPPITVRSTVGAGDSSLAGYLLAAVRGAGPAERLRSAIGYGAAATSLDGTQPPTPNDLPTGDIPVHALPN